MWHTWSEARQPSGSSFAELLEQDCNGFSATLLESIHADEAASLHGKCPTPMEVSRLWDHYLLNVHPLTKLFFDWDKKPIFLRAEQAPQALSKAEQAFTLAIYFVTILSLSDEECQELMNGSERHELLDDYQSSVEAALLAAGYASTTDLLVLQAFLLYLLAMRNRAKPATWYSMMGIVLRIAQRIGLHKDGSALGLPPVEAEEKRRVWWQIQHMDLMIAQLLGCISLTVYANWDTKMPANLDDSDISPGMETLPSENYGLTSMSHCLWRYSILYKQKSNMDPRQPAKDFSWVTSRGRSEAEKQLFVAMIAQDLNTRYVQYCDLLNPLHMSMQIGIRAFIISVKRIINHPEVTNIKISDIPKLKREELLKNSTEAMEYYVLSETTPLIARYRWLNENYFQWPAFVYIIIEAHHRAITPEAAALWTLIDKVCSIHPKLINLSRRPDTIAITRLIILAWRQRLEFFERNNYEATSPKSVTRMEEWLGILERSEMTPDSAGKQPGTGMGMGMEGFMDLDFDMIDWSAWEQDGYVQALK